MKNETAIKPFIDNKLNILLSRTNSELCPELDLYLKSVEKYVAVYLQDHKNVLDMAGQFVENNILEFLNLDVFIFDFHSKTNLQLMQFMSELELMNQSSGRMIFVYIVKSKNPSTREKAYNDMILKIAYSRHATVFNTISDLTETMDDTIDPVISFKNRIEKETGSTIITMKMKANTSVRKNNVKLS